MTLPAEDLKARVLTAAKRNPAPHRRTVRLYLAFLIAAIGLILLGALEGEGGIQWTERPGWFIVGTSLGWAVSASVATWLAGRRGRSMVGRPRALLWAAAIGTPLLLFGWSVLWNFLYPETFHVTHPERIGLKCFDLVLTTAALPLVGLAFWRCRTDPVHPGATGAALGAAMGAWAGLTINLSCESTNPAHVLLGHVGPVAVLVLAGLMLGRRLGFADRASEVGGS